MHKHKCEWIHTFRIDMFRKASLLSRRLIHSPGKERPLIACFRSNVWGCYCSYSKNFWSVLKQKLPAFRQMSKDRDCDAQLISEKNKRGRFCASFTPMEIIFFS